MTNIGDYWWLIVVVFAGAGFFFVLFARRGDDSSQRPSALGYGFFGPFWIKRALSSREWIGWAIFALILVLAIVLLSP